MWKFDGDIDHKPTVNFFCGHGVESLLTLTYNSFWTRLNLAQTLLNHSLGCLKFASNLNFKMNPPQNCSLLVPYEVYIKLFPKIQCFHPVLASWLSSIHLLEMIIFLLTTPLCHTSKVASWHVDWGYEPNIWSYLGKILN